METLIKNIFLESDKLLMVKKTITDNWENEVFLTNYFINLDISFYKNGVILELFTDFLQIINDESIFSQYELLDIEKLYMLQIEIFPDNISLYIDLAYFYSNVLNDVKKAKTIVEVATKKANTFIEKLKEIDTE